MLQLITALAGDQFSTDFPSGLAAVDPVSGNWTWLCNSYFGLRWACGSELPQCCLALEHSAASSSMQQQQLRCMH